MGDIMKEWTEADLAQNKFMNSLLAHIKKIEADLASLHGQFKKNDLVRRVEALEKGK